MYTAHISDNFYFYKNENPPFDIPGLRSQFVFRNPQYDEALRLGYSTYRIAPEIPVMKERDDRLEFRRGCIGKLERLLGEIHLIDETVTRPAEVSGDISLRPEQQKMLDAFLNRNQGTGVGPPAFGKTRLGVAATGFCPSIWRDRRSGQ